MKNSCLRILGIAAALALVAAAVTAIVGWRLGWNTPRQFGDGLFWAGAVLVVIGLLSVMGSYEMHSLSNVRYSETAGDAKLADRARQWMSDLAQGWQSLIYLVLAGGLLFAASIWMGSLSNAAP